MFEELKTFISVIEHNNFTKAGEALNLSQPSVSTHIKNLENYFGTTLINRSVRQKNIYITESGYTLYKRAKEILNLVDTTYIEVKTLSDTIKGVLKIGASLTIGEYLLPNFLTYFSKKYPDVDVEIYIGNTTKIASKVKGLSLDIGLVEGIISSPYLTQKYFLEDKMVLAFSKENKNFLKDFNFNKLHNQKWILREEGSGTREYLDMFLYTNKIPPKSIMILGSNYAVKEAVKNDLGITIISSLVTSPAVKNNELSVIELDNMYNRSFSYLIPNNIIISKTSEIFIKELKEYNFENLTTI